VCKVSREMNKGADNILQHKETNEKTSILLTATWLSEINAEIAAITVADRQKWKLKSLQF
jgi:hypothetical protein